MLLTSVRQFVRRHDLFGPRTPASSPPCPADRIRWRSRIFCASSTPPASCASSGLAHFNHQLRAAADDDERFVAALGGIARRAGADRPRRRGGACAPRAALDRRCRRVRHGTPFSSARALLAAADVVALGHTRDDQAETVSAPSACAAPGRAASAGCIRVTVTLFVRFSAAGAPTSGNGWATVRCPSSRTRPTRDVSIPRNRVRAELLPLLEARFNPGDRRRAGRRGRPGARSLAVDGRDGRRTSRHASCVRSLHRKPNSCTRWTSPTWSALPLALRRARAVARDERAWPAGGRFRSATSRRPSV